MAQFALICFVYCLYGFGFTYREIVFVQNMYHSVSIASDNYSYTIFILLYFPPLFLPAHSPKHHAILQYTFFAYRTPIIMS